MTRTQPASFFDRIVARSLDRPLPVAVQYGIAALVILLVGWLRVRYVQDTLPWLFFIPATIAIALTTGKAPGMFAALLSAVIGMASLQSAHGVLGRSEAQWIAVGLFLVVDIALVMLVAELRESMRRSRQLNIDLVDSELQALERERFLASIFASSTDCIKVLDLEGRLTFMSEGGQRVMEVSDFGAIEGCPWPDFWQGGLNQEALDALEAARAGKAYSFIGETETMAGTPKWWHVAVSPILGAGGKPAHILSVSRDISELRASEEQRDRFVHLAENSTDFIGMAYADGRVFYMNDAAKRLVGLEDADISQHFIADFFPPDHLDTIANIVLPAVQRDGHWAGELDFRHFRTGELIPVLYSVFPVTDASGKLIGYGTVTRDFRDRRRAAEDMQMMNGELAHRLKNVLAVVQSVAQQTLRNAANPATAAENLGSRLMALGAATDLLTGSSWQSADLHQIAGRALAPHGEIGRQILIDGPTITLNPKVTVALALAFHELATNAAKYGALSEDGGTVSLSWRADGEGKDAVFVLDWKERGGPPVVVPMQRGFGSTLIERSLRAYFRGSAETEYAPDGLEFRLNAPMADAAAIITR